MGVAFQVRGFRACRRLESFPGMEPKSPARVEHGGVNASVERATRAGASAARRRIHMGDGTILPRPIATPSSWILAPGSLT
jgi:hypothetical protein